MGARRDIVLTGAQEFKVSERYIYKLMVEAFEKGKLVKNKDRWAVTDKQGDLF